MKFKRTIRKYVVKLRLAKPTLFEIYYGYE